MEHQLEAIKHLGTGKVLWGGVGCGKSATVLGYYVEKETPRDIIVITTAKKRDSLDWEREAAKFGIGVERNGTIHGVIKIDSWNNIGNYVGIEDAFFVFDEQRLVGYGSWVQSFLKIAKVNNWVLLSATPGDTWLDYAPIFIANGFYKNITDFKLDHVLYEPFVKFPMIRGYLNEQKLEWLRNDTLVEMPYLQESKRVMNWLDMAYDLELFKKVYKDRWNPYEDRPVKDVAEMFRLMRRISNSDPSRLEMIHDLMKLHPRLVIFYNFNYELEILRGLSDRINVLEWNGHKKDLLPEGGRWVYLVQYVAGAEGWNCTSTNAMVLYSLTYSYKNFMQAQGRIDRMDTKYDTLYYYLFVSNSLVDRAVRNSLKDKKRFNERRFLAEMKELEGDDGEIVELCQIRNGRVTGISVTREIEKHANDVQKSDNLPKTAETSKRAKFPNFE